MLIDDFGSENKNKQNIAREICETLRNDGSKNATTSFYGYNFDVKEPWYCGGSIETNCQTGMLYGKDLNIIKNFNIGNLERFLDDLSYLKELAEKRIADISRIKGVIELNVERYKEGNKKLCRVFVTTYDLVTDGYSDSEIINKHVIEEFTFSDTLKLQAEIEEKIKELEEKYDVKQLPKN